MTDTRNVTAGKPKIGGAIYSAPTGTALPTDALTELNVAFKNLGYISEDGLTNTNTPEAEVVRSWGGDIVLTVQTSKEDKFTYKLIEALNLDVLKEVYGQDNVTGSIDTGVTIKANSKALEERAIIIDVILKEGALKRIVIPRATVAEVGEIAYKANDAVGYETTVNAAPDQDGNTHYEYIIKKQD